MTWQVDNVSGNQEAAVIFLVTRKKPQERGRKSYFSKKLYFLSVLLFRFRVKNHLLSVRAIPVSLTTLFIFRETKLLNISFLYLSIQSLYSRSIHLFDAFCLIYANKYILSWNISS